jgi:hypothetical protein
VEYSNHVGAYPAGNPGRQQLELLGFQMWEHELIQNPCSTWAIFSISDGDLCDSDGQVNNMNATDMLVLHHLQQLKMTAGSLTGQKLNPETLSHQHNYTHMEFFWRKNIHIKFESCRLHS